MFSSILLFGYGNLASAMLEGWLASGLEAECFTVYNPRPKPVPAGVGFTTEVPTSSFDAIVLGVKPQKFVEISSKVEPLAGPDMVLVSILAGVDLATLTGVFHRAGGIVRLIPNLASALGKSPNVLVAGPMDQERRAAVNNLALRLGSAEWLDNEAETDLVTALTASGPAFVYRFIDALAAGASGLGLDRARAERLAVQMVEGAAALSAASPHSPAELARRVASPGGMTQRGLDVLDAGQVLEKVVKGALTAARDRSRELREAARD